MRIRTLLPALGLAGAAALAGCDSALTLAPTGEVEESQAIVDPVSARAALTGVYDALTSGSYYGGDFLFYNDLLSDNAEHSGTFDTFADADANAMRSDDGVVEDVWDALYAAVGRANVLIARLPDVQGLPPGEFDQMLGEAYFVRALAYHDLVRTFGDVPIRTEPPSDITEASQVARSPKADVYVQINADLDQAAALMGEDEPTGGATLGAVLALRARVKLYQADWAAAEAAATTVLDLGYELAPTYGALFGPEDQDTPEDIFRLTFTPQEYNLQGYYYQSRSNGGRAELRPTADLADAYEDGDARGEWSIDSTATRRWGNKWRTTEGGEDIHVIRLGEVLLIKAEAHARQNELADAVAEYNKLRVRAGLAPHVLGVDVTTQQQVLDAIDRERRVELAFEGDRFPDLARTGRGLAVLGIDANRLLWPIPLNEIDVAPNLTQNPGY